MNKIDYYKKITEEYYQKYEAYLPAFFFFAGFFFDIFTLGQIDELANLLTQFIYLLFASYLLILEFTNFKENTQSNKALLLLQKYHDEVFHFLLGSLLSAFALFFFKSASVANSFLFIILFVFLLVINEFEAFQKLGKMIRFLLLLLCFICYFTLLIPILIGSIGSFLFLISMTISTLLLFGFYKYLKVRELIPSIEAKRIILAPGIVMITIFILFYFLQIIPPVPLSLESIGIYHNVKKEHSAYKLYHERTWYRFWETGDQRFIARTGDKLFVFVSIFSPGGFSDSVNLRWMRYINGEFKTSDKIKMKITGGRGAGFRGFSFKSNYLPGEYRVKVETMSGLEIGRINLEVIKATSENLQEKRSFKIDLNI
ncbi:MAG: DUF2914 domain-containing protein [Bacteriovoracaceae bacterium]|jgi:hypothetical protein|nr:DUF2914 domain-containing protein [Bacteriovoracaceae bacterium]